MTQLAKQILTFLKTETQKGKSCFNPLDISVSQNASFKSTCEAIDELESYGYISFKEDIIGSFYLIS